QVETLADFANMPMHASFRGMELYSSAPNGTLEIRRWHNFGLLNTRTLNLGKNIVYPAAIADGGNFYGITDEKKLYAWDGQSGAVLSGFPITHKGTPVTGPTFVDRDNDMYDEILVQFSNGKKALYSRDGQLLDQVNLLKFADS